MREYPRDGIGRRKGATGSLLASETILPPAMEIPYCDRALARKAARACSPGQCAMINGLFQHTSIPVLQEVVAFTQARQRVLAGNVANIHVPGYRTRDLSVDSFQEALRKQIAAGRAEDFTSPGHPVSPRKEALQKVKDSMNNIVYHDGTNLDIERLAVESSKNQYMHNLAVSIMTSQFQLMHTAINERV